MSVEMLGSYATMLQQLHQLVLGIQPAAPVAPQPAPYSAPSLGRDTYSPSPARDPNANFISQVQDARWNPSAPQGNTNCGPASLAMALKTLGLAPPGLTDPGNPEAWVEQTRMAMEGDRDNFRLTSDDDVLRGALASGASAAKVHGVDGVLAAVNAGKLVVVAGNPKSYENRFSNDQYAHFNGGHFIMVSAVNGDQVTVSDPQSHAGSFTISRQELENYMAYRRWNVGVALSR